MVRIVARLVKASIFLDPVVMLHGSSANSIKTLHRPGAVLVRAWPRSEANVYGAVG